MEMLTADKSADSCPALLLKIDSITMDTKK